ncbi:hypothetical protein [Acetivibrio cellulolyticus]|uniref:hypothetical protein n=1 Tax=Acetivibrio cellulolyticus TaxID=35830 RepID=UPI0001E2E28A|nr:hypothetical protein [Acetivibrio cellulolyticus]
MEDFDNSRSDQNVFINEVATEIVPEINISIPLGELRKTSHLERLGYSFEVGV